MDQQPKKSDKSLQTTAVPSPASNQDETSAVSRWRRLWDSQWGNIKVLVIALLVALVVRVFIAEPRFIPSNSMDPTLHIGDRLIVDKVTYRWQFPHQGDIIVFRPPPQLVDLGYELNQAFIKRIIGEPGHIVQVTNGLVYLDGKALREPYILESPHYEMPPIAVPPGYVFVMGDNRNDSNDSHVWGVLPEENIIGRAWYRFWPLDRLGWIDD
jgi:signal peptidase I